MDFKKTIKNSSDTFGKSTEIKDGVCKCKGKYTDRGNETCGCGKKKDDTCKCKGKYTDRGNETCGCGKKKDMKESKFEQYLIEQQEEQDYVLSRIESLLESIEVLEEDINSIAAQLGTGSAVVNRYIAGNKNASDAQIIMALFNNIKDFEKYPKAKQAIEQLYQKNKKQIDQLLANQKTRQDFEKDVNRNKINTDMWGSKQTHKLN